MARIRTIKPEFWSSPDTAKASPWARLLYIAMWNFADDWGRAEWNERALAAFAFPFDAESPTTAAESPTTAAEFPRLVAEVCGCFGVVFYRDHHGRRYYAIPSWDAHQRAEKRAGARVPGPDSDGLEPDEAVYSLIRPSVGDSAASVGDSAASVGSSVPGTGEQGNRGTGEHTPSTGAPGRGLAVVESPAAPAPAGAGPRPADDPDFDAFWTAYPRRVDKKPARKAWRAARRRAPADVITAAAAEYARQVQAAGTQPRFIKHPSTWLNADGWTETEHTPPPALTRADQNTLAAIDRSARTGGRGVFASLFETTGAPA